MNKKKLINIGLIVLGLVFILQWRVWLKLVGVVALGFGIFRLIKEKNQTAAQEEPVPREQDTAMNTEIRQLQQSIRGFRWGFYIAGAITVVLLLANAIVPMIIVAIIGGVLKMLQESKEGDLKKYIAGNIVQQALEDVFDDITYESGGCLPERHIRGSAMGISSYDYIRGSDYVKGTYKGLPIEMSDVQLVAESVTTDEDGNEQRSESTVFQGLWLVCDFGKELSADLRLWERGKLGKVLGGKGVQTENERFNKYFHVESQIEQEAFYILTPHMMEYILEMDKKANGKTHMRFERGGKVQIAIDSGRDAFEISKKEKDATLLRKKFVQQIRYVTDIIDELRLVDTLYRA